jgi:hypothetical protein
VTPVPLSHPSSSSSSSSSSTISVPRTNQHTDSHVIETHSHASHVSSQLEGTDAAESHAYLIAQAEKKKHCDELAHMTSAEQATRDQQRSADRHHFEDEFFAKSTKLSHAASLDLDDDELCSEVNALSKDDLDKLCETTSTHVSLTQCVGQKPTSTPTSTASAPKHACDVDVDGSEARAYLMAKETQTKREETLAHMTPGQKAAANRKASEDRHAFEDEFFGKAAVLAPSSRPAIHPDKQRRKRQVEVSSEASKIKSMLDAPRVVQDSQTTKTTIAKTNVSVNKLVSQVENDQSGDDAHEEDDEELMRQLARDLKKGANLNDLLDI